MKILVLALFVSGILHQIANAQYSIELDLTEQKAYLLYNGRAVMESEISSGRPGHLTPGGTFQITNKDLNHVSSIYGHIIDNRNRTVVADADVDMPKPPGTRFVNAPMHYFMQFAPGIGLHAGYLPGYPASHGCVRMPEAKAIAFYNAVSVGTPVTVFGSIETHRLYQARQQGEEPYDEEDANRRYYDRFHSDPSYYRGRVIVPGPFGFWPN